MRYRLVKWCATGLGLIALILATDALYGCSIPVFRYALERWEADPYEAVVFHRGPLDEEHEAIVSSFQKREMLGENTVNLRLHTIDLDKELPETLARIWEEQDNPGLPWMVILFPISSDVQKPLWSGPPSKEILDTIADSPKRREIARRLLAGESSVWVFLESGDATKDETALTSLTTQLDLCEKELELPPLDAPGPEQPEGTLFSALQPVTMESTLPLRLDFSILRLSRNDPAENVFVDMLMKTEPDLFEYVEEPMVFPIFGRGRSLYTLVGKGINEMTIGRAAFFLTGACSCEIKAYNPGTDLLMRVDWDGVLRNLVTVEEILPELTGVFPAGGEVPPPPPGKQTPTEKPGTVGDQAASRVVQTVALSLGAVVLLVAGGTLFISRRQKA